MKGLHGIIFSYEKENGLRELIENRVHGSVPFGGDYRIIDFILSSMVNAGITDVGVIMHGKCQSLLDHLGSGKSWDLSRNFGGLTLLPAFAYNERSHGDGQFRGRVEALYSVMNYLRSIRQDYVVLSDSDTIINMPLEDVLARHIATGADITAVCTAAGGDGQDTYFRLDGGGRITDTAYELYTPSGYRCLNIFVLRTELLVQLVTECISRNGYSLRRNILQEMGNRLKLYGYVYDGYAAHISTLQNYYDRSMELLDTGVRGRLFCPERPVYGKENDSPSSYIDPEGGCVNSLVADGCDIQGSVKNCVLFRNVRIEKGASVENCILFKDTVVKRGAVLRGVITDKYVTISVTFSLMVTYLSVTISENVTLMGHERYPIVIAKGATV